VRIKFHRAKCSGSRIIVRTEKRSFTKTIQSVATADSNHVLRRNLPTDLMVRVGVSSNSKLDSTKFESRSALAA